MPIKNRGLFNLTDVSRRQIETDWPAANTNYDLNIRNVFANSNILAQNIVVDSITSNTWNRLFTSNVIEGPSGLYYTNARVGSYLSENDVTVQSLTVQGDLTVQGNTTTLNTATLVIEDKNIVLANGALNSAAADGAGITIDGAQANITYVSTGDKFTVNKLLEVQGFSVLTANSSTTDLGEGNNLYYTNSRVQTHLDISGYQTAANILANVQAYIDLSGNTTTDLTEGDNLYYTNARVQSHLDAGGYQTAANILANVQAYTDLSGNTTTDLAEGTNLYYTNARVQSFVETLVVSANLSASRTDDLAEGNVNLYYTNTRVQAYLDISGYQTAENILANVSVSGADLSGNTTTDLAEGDNLYYTNDRVISAFTAGDNINIESNGTIRANLVSVGSDVLPSETETYDLGSADKKWKDLYLSGNSITLGGATITSTGDTVRVSSLDIVNRGTLYTGGRNIEVNPEGVISTTSDPSPIYDVEIDNQVTQLLTNTMDTIFTTPSTAGYRYLIHSIALTNISGNTAIFSSNLIYNNNTYVYANSFAIPYGYTIDLIEKPEVLLPNTQVRMMAQANDTIAAYIVYKAVQDNTYFSEFERINTSNTYNTVLVNSSASILESVKILNRSDINLRGTLVVVDGNDVIKTYLASNTLLAKNYYSEMLLNPVRMPTAYKLKFAYFNGPSNAITSFVSGRVSETYSVAANTTTINEGQSVTFTITTTNVVDNSTRYFRTLGNVISSDFIEGNTGSFTIFSNTGNVTLTANSDLSISEPVESFKLQIVRDSVDGEILHTSDPTVIVNDTSNIVGVQSVILSSSNIEETQAVTFTVNTNDADGTGNTLLYYTITGNADIYGGNSGSFTVNNDVGTLEFIAESSLQPGEIRSYAVEIRSGSITGNVIFTSNTVTVNPYIPEQSLTATGGNEVFVSPTADYKVHVFKSSNTFSVTKLASLSPINKFDYLLIGGGGAGFSGGGGAGGLLEESNITISSTKDMVVTIGAGDTATPSTVNGSAGTGTPSTLTNTPTTKTATGGGAGGGFTYSSTNPGAAALTGSNGGSGGGGGGWYDIDTPFTPVAYPGGTGTPGQGFAGGAGRVSPTSPSANQGSNGGGGGGAGGVGSGTGPFAAAGGNGGVGKAIPWLPSSYGTTGPTPGRWFAGGGGGGSAYYLAPPMPAIANTSGGAGGGGNGVGNSVQGTAGTVNTGGGGGGGRSSYNSPGNSSAGGSGFAAIRYPIFLGTANARISKVVTFTANANTLNRNTSVLFTVNTQRATNGETLYYTTSANVSETAFLQGNTGSFSVTGNTGTITLTTGNENLAGPFNLQIRRGSTTGTILATSEEIRANTNNFTVQSVNVSAANIAETQAVTFTVNTIGLSGNAAATLYYSTSGNADIFGGNTGSFVINDNSAPVELIAESSVPDGETRAFALQVREGSATGNILFTSSTVTVEPAAAGTPGLTATGGTVTTEGNYKVHVFTTSNTFVVSSLASSSPGNLMDVVGVGGGGGGAQGGGGAGGFVERFTQLLESTGNIVVTIGSGGALSSADLIPTIATDGGNTTLTGFYTLTAVGGGRGGAQDLNADDPIENETGYPGGSGGGGGGESAPASPFGTRAGGAGYNFPGPTQQGYPGGAGQNWPTQGVAGGGGGGAANAGVQGGLVVPDYRGGDGGVGLSTVLSPPAYGTPGPAPGRYFAGGGGGGGSLTTPTAVGGDGGYGGGGTGGGGATKPGFGGTVNTGGGGGGGRGDRTSPGPGGNGGSGIVIIRYPAGSAGTANSRISLVASVTSNTTSLTPSTEIVFTINTFNSANSATLYYDTLGNVSNSTFVQGNTGSFTVNGNVGTVTLTTSNEAINGTFRLRVRRASTTGAILASSNVITYTGI